MAAAKGSARTPLGPKVENKLGLSCAKLRIHLSCLLSLRYYWKFDLYKIYFANFHLLVILSRPNVVDHV